MRAPVMLALLIGASIASLSSMQAYADAFRDEANYISRIPVINTAKVYSAFENKASIKLRLSSVDYSDFAQNSGVLLTREGNDGLVVEVPERALTQQDASVHESGSFISSTFVVDYDESSTKSLFDELLKSEISLSTADAIEAAIEAAISTKNRRRGFDIASTVARTREGDCTEHAVLLSAISRMQGLPSKIVIGFVVVGFEDDPQAFGHAWNEVFLDGKWQLVDAALRNLREKVFYVPTGNMKTEGPGYNMELFTLMQGFPTAITIL